MSAVKKTPSDLVYRDRMSTPQTLASRRSSRLIALQNQKTNPCVTNSSKPHSPSHETFSKAFSPLTSHLSDTNKKRKRKSQTKEVIKRSGISQIFDFEKTNNKASKKRRVYYKKVVYDGCEFEVGDDVYVKRREDAFSDEEPEIEECRVCFKAGKAVMIECDDCLGGFHLKCLKPPQKEVPEGNWTCDFCKDQKLGREVKLPVPPPEGKGKKKRMRTAKDKLLSSDLWAAHIERLWKEPDGAYLLRVCWYIIPEETAVGRQPHNLRRELYITNDFADIELESVIRHCYVVAPKDFSKAEGDDVFLCEYEYDTHWQSFKHRADMEMDGTEEDNNDTESDKDWKSCKSTKSHSESEEELEYLIEEVKCSINVQSSAQFLAVNSRKGQVSEFQKMGLKKIPNFRRRHKQTELDKAKSALLLGTFPTCPPCRNKEIAEITAFVKGVICDDNCLGRCLYVYGVPGTGKTMSVLSVMKNLKSEANAGRIKPYRFVEINGLKLSSPENIYKVIYEGLSGHRVGWKKALGLLNERFSDSNKKCNNQPCILLIDEFDLLVTKKQSILYNILDWPTKPNSKLVVIGIANTMDLPEKLLPRISSRMGVQRLCFQPYNYQQLQEIISNRLKGIDAFETEAIEFASRKVAANSGDARPVLEICRRAVELAIYRTGQSESLANFSSVAHKPALVGLQEIKSAINELFEAPHIQLMRKCSKYVKIFLTALVWELNKTGMGETTFEKVDMCVRCICQSNKEAFPEQHILFKFGCDELSGLGMVICEDECPNPRIQLSFPSNDVAFALKECEELPWLAKYL